MLAPIVTGLTVSVAFWLTQRWTSARGIVEMHDLRIRNMIASIERQIRDLDRLYLSTRRRLTLARLAMVISEPKDAHQVLAKYVGKEAFLESAKEYAGQAAAGLHQFRDEVNRNVEEYELIVRRETFWSERLRRKTKTPVPSLKLSDSARNAVKTWHNASYEHPDQGKIKVEPQGPNVNERWVEAMETETGVTPEIAKE